MRPGAFASDPAGNRTPTTKDCPIDVRNHGGELVGRVTLSKSHELVTAGLLSPFTRHGRIKYLLLNRDEPTLERPWRGGNHTTTERRRDDWGVITGAPKSGLQHKPLPREN